MPHRPTPPQTRGQTARRPSEIPPAGWRDIVVRIYRKLAQDHVTVVAAGVAFFGLFAIFPAIGAVVAIAGYIFDPAQITELLSGLFQILPPNAALIIREQLATAAGASQAASGLGAVFGILLALYGVMRGVKTLMEGMNFVFEEEEKRGFIALNLAAAGLTLLLILGVLLGLAAMVALPAIAALAELPPAVDTLIGIARWIVMALLTVLGLAVIYRYGPSRRNAKWRWISPGALAGTVLWLIGTLAFSLYARNFANYNATYGAIGGVIALLVWLWLSALVVLIGAELDAEMEHQTLVDSTVGPPKPMGSRGAVKADTVPEDLPRPERHGDGTGAPPGGKNRAGIGRRPGRAARFAMLALAARSLLQAGRR